METIELDRIFSLSKKDRKRIIPEASFIKKKEIGGVTWKFAGVKLEGRGQNKSDTCLLACREEGEEKTWEIKRLKNYISYSRIRTLLLRPYTTDYALGYNSRQATMFMVKVADKILRDLSGGNLAVEMFSGYDTSLDGGGYTGIEVVNISGGGR